MTNPKSPKNRKKRDRGKVFETRRAAFRAAKRDNGVPVTKHPDEVIRPRTPRGDEEKLDQRNRRLYIFYIIEVILGMFLKKEIHIREDKKAFYGKKHGNQLDHFNSGDTLDEKLRKHHYYKRRNR